MDVERIYHFTTKIETNTSNPIKPMLYYRKFLFDWLGRDTL